MFTNHLTSITSDYQGILKHFSNDSRCDYIIGIQGSSFISFLLLLLKQVGLIEEN